MDIIPAHHRGGVRFDQLKLVDNQSLVPETGLTLCKVQLPYPGETLILKTDDIIPVAEEILPPGFECLCVMQE